MISLLDSRRRIAVGVGFLAGVGLFSAVFGFFARVGAQRHRVSCVDPLLERN
jgi:hypothetical protein